MDLSNLIDSLADGVVLIKFYPKKRPEKRLFVVRKESRQLGWKPNLPPDSSKPFEGLGEARTAGPAECSVPEMTGKM